MTAHYRIGEFADLAGVSARTLRFYDEIGLLRPASVDPRTGYRHYLPKQLEELASIVALKNLGVPLGQVRDLTGKGKSPRDQKTILNELKLTLQQSIQMAGESLKWVDAALRELEESRAPVAVIVKRRPATTIASVRAKVDSYEQVPQLERDLLRGLPAGCLGNLRGVLWHRCADSGTLEAEPFVALKSRFPRSSHCDVRQLPGAVLACAYSEMDDESAEHAYSTIRRWMEVRGYRLAGPKRELNLGQMLEIQFPLSET